ncbi:ATP-binding protein [Agromyces sp. SYSU K20354]|uniref:ATP-binding protein n=1 Tax=Agromyces cavernae TaxID=2898659 RepID=UPI001E3E71F0|nr:ATP-binding protein [Agromyces cavernae]MCD2441444.1 ATP-binding protein [Agromyces cavernae]
MTETIAPTSDALSRQYESPPVLVAEGAPLAEDSTSAEDIVDVIRLAPDAGLVNSLGTNHTLESAIADLVDNSIDAGARRVSVRLLTSDDRLTEVEVLDDGRGMDTARVDAAMTIGYQRDYQPGDLGHFGMGLKAASFGHSDILTVWSAQEEGDPVGRRIRRADFSKDFSCEVLASARARERAQARLTILGSERGTTVVWNGIRNAYRGSSSSEARNWLSARSDALRAHLGVTFHRLLADGRLELDVLVDELDVALEAPGIPVLPIDPFSYASSGNPRYPKKLMASGANHTVEMSCHIWPAKADVTGFRIGSKTGEKFQGFYIYRHDRLLQAGGWSDAAHEAPARQLARVLIDDDGALGTFLTMNPEKSGMKFEPSFHDAISGATAIDGTTFIEFLQDAESTYAEATKRNRGRKPAIRPDKGLPPGVRKRVGSELPLIDGDSVDLKWKTMPIGEFFDVDYPARTVWLNSRYRALFAPQGGSLNDAPVVKTLLYLLSHHIFEGKQLGSRDKDDIALWKSLLGAAVVAEDRMRGDSSGTAAR